MAAPKRANLADPAVAADVRALSIGEVAARYDVSPSAVRKWRAKLGLGSPTLAARLRPNRHLLGRVPDADIGFIVQASAEEVARYRQKHRIPKQGTHPLVRSEAQAYIALLPLSEVIARYGVCRSAVTYHRKAQGLPLLRRNLESWEVDAITRTAGEETDTDIAEALGRSGAVVNKVRREHDLSSWRQQRKELRPQRVAELRKRLTQGADVPKEG